MKKRILHLNMSLSMILTTLLVGCTPSSEFNYKDFTFKRSMDPSEFFSFIGISYADKVEKSFELYGVPGWRRESTRINYYEFGAKFDGLTVGADVRSKRIESVDLPARALNLDRLKIIPDEKTKLLGKTREEIFLLLGRPDSVSHGFVEYKYAEGNRSGLVTFYCPEFNYYECTEIRVHWFYHTYTGE